MGVGSDPFGKDAQPRIAVARFDVAEDLIVGAIFADDVEAVFDGALRAYLGRDRTAIGNLADDPLVGPQRAALVGLLAVFRHLLLVGHVDDAQGAAIEAGDVFAHARI